MIDNFLFVTQLYPTEFNKSVYGIFRRMRLFLEATNQLTRDLHILIYVNADFRDLDKMARETERGLLVHWNLKATVTLAPFATPREKSVWHHYIAPIFNPFRHLIYEPLAGREQVDAFDHALAMKPDAIFFHRIETMCPALLSKMPLPPCMLDIDDIEHVKFFRSVRQKPHWAAKRLYYLHIPALISMDRRAIKLARRAFVCSRHDQEYLSRYLGLRNIGIVPNSVEIPNSINTPSSKTLLFIGTYSYDPNVAAVEYLISDIWSLIHRRLPDAKLLIVGNNQERIPSFGRNLAGVVFTGFVENLSKLYDEIRVVCCPILSGGGTRLKIIEAAAHGKPVVSTRIGAEGLDFKIGEEIVLEDDPVRFAEACIELLSDATRSKKLGIAARETAMRIYDRHIVVDNIRRELEYNILSESSRNADAIRSQESD